MKKKIISLGILVFLSSCSTAQVTHGCQATEDVVISVQEELGILPIEIRSIVAAIGFGARICGSEGYAIIREKVIDFLYQYR